MFSKSRSWLSLACVLAAPLVAFAQLPAFPGADGAAANVAGGRGGIVYHVTKLDQNFSDAVPGTLRYGLTDSNFAAGTKRTIVFDVAGTFWLGRFGADQGHDNGWDNQSRINIGTNVTIAGQTAPGPVNIMGGVIKFSNDAMGNSNSIVRNITVAPGYGMRSFENPSATDEMGNPAPEYPDAGNPVLGGPATPRDYPDSFVFDAFDITAKNVMIDHVSTFYATDETISVNEDGGAITVQYTNISQAQNYPQADAEGNDVDYSGHGLGSLLQPGSNQKVSVVNNLYAHLSGRIPRVGSEVGTGSFNDFRNNVFYNWLSAGTGGGTNPPQHSFNNFINNFYLVGHGGNGVSQTAGEDGQSGTLDDLPVITNQGASSDPFNGNSVTRVYASGNLRDTNLDADPNDTSSADGLYGGVSQSTAYDVNIGVTLGAADAFNNVMNYVGARWWDRSGSVDERIVNETLAGTGQVVAWADDPFNDYETPPGPGYDPYDPEEGAEWRELLSYRADPVDGSAPFNRAAGWDTDGDGMPNQWEAEHGLNASVANNNADFDADGYTDLEEYLNDTAAWPAPAPMVFSASLNSRFEQIQNWEVSGVNVNVAGSSVTSKSKWQPSRFDEARINSGTVTLNSVGQHAGTLKIGTAPGTATLNITGGWLKVEDVDSEFSTGEVIIGADAGSTAALNLSGGRLVAKTISKGAGGSFNFTGGILSAEEVNFDLVNNGGTISPGNSPGQTHVVGDLTINSGAVLIELASALDFDQILVDDVASIAGNLNVLLLESFLPAPTDVIEILSADTLSGVFSNAPTSVFASFGTFDVTYTATSVLLSNFELSEFLPGDFNDNGVIDAADYTVWRDAMTAGSTFLTNDPTPGVVDESDFSYWRANFGTVFGGGGQGTAVVPEPSTLSLTTLGLLVLAAARRRQD